MTKTAQRISNLLVAAIDPGGERASGYWCYRCRLLWSAVTPRVALASLPRNIMHPWYSDPKVFTRPFEAELVYDKTYEGMGDGRKVFTGADCRRALKVMAKEEYLGSVGAPDTFVQCLVYGEIVHGGRADRERDMMREARVREWIKEMEIAERAQHQSP